MSNRSEPIKPAREIISGKLKVEPRDATAKKNASVLRALSVCSLLITCQLPSDNTSNNQSRLGSGSAPEAESCRQGMCLCDTEGRETVMVMMMLHIDRFDTARPLTPCPVVWSLHCPLFESRLVPFVSKGEGGKDGNDKEQRVFCVLF